MFLLFFLPVVDACVLCGKHASFFFFAVKERVCGVAAAIACTVPMTSVICQRLWPASTPLPHLWSALLP